jgi:hypothetical protein
MCLWSTFSWWSSKSRKLHAFIDALIFCCFMKLSGRRFWDLSWSHIDSADAITSDSFGLVARPCLRPNLNTDSCSRASVSPERLVIISFGLFLIPVEIACSYVHGAVTPVVVSCQLVFERVILVWYSETMSFGKRSITCALVGFSWDVLRNCVPLE